MDMIHNFSASRRGDNKSSKRDMGSYSVQCDRSGLRSNASDCVLEWNGLFVRKEFAEARHPQDLIKPRRESTEVPIARPRNTDLTITQSDPPDWDSY